MSWCKWFFHSFQRDSYPSCGKENQNIENQVTTKISQYRWKQRNLVMRKVSITKNNETNSKTNYKKKQRGLILCSKCRLDFTFTFTFYRQRSNKNVQCIFGNERQNDFILKGIYLFFQWNKKLLQRIWARKVNQGHIQYNLFSGILGINYTLFKMPYNSKPYEYVDSDIVNIVLGYSSYITNICGNKFFFLNNLARGCPL